MKKSDLKDGMVVEYNYGNLYLMLNGKFVGEKGCNSPDRVDEETLCAPNSKIMAVYKINMDKISKISRVFDKENLELIWSRDIWSKVKPYTKVQVRDSDDEKWRNAYLIKYNKSHIYQFEVTFNLQDEFTGIKGTTYNYKYCRLYKED